MTISIHIFRRRAPHQQIKRAVISAAVFAILTICGGKILQGTVLLAIAPHFSQIGAESTGSFLIGLVSIILNAFAVMTIFVMPVTFASLFAVLSLPSWLTRKQDAETLHRWILTATAVALVPCAAVWAAELFFEPRLYDFRWFVLYWPLSAALAGGRLGVFAKSNNWGAR